MSSAFEQLRDHIKRGDTIAVRKYLEADGDANIHNETGECALSVAAFAGQTQIAELFLQAGALVDGHSKDDWTPLYLACMNGHERTVRALLKAGASRQVMIYGKPIMYWLSVQGDRHKIIKLLEQ